MANCGKNDFLCGNKCVLFPPRKICDTYCLYILCIISGFRIQDFFEGFFTIAWQGRGLHFSSLRHVTNYRIAFASGSVI